MDKFCMYSHVQNNIVPNSNQQNKVFAPTAARALIIAHADPINDSHPPVVMLYVETLVTVCKATLKWKCEMVVWNQAYGLLALLVAAGEENQLGLHWPCKVDF